MAKHVVLERLKRLVAKGYMVRWGDSEQDTLRLEHPRAPDLTLFSDGRVWVLTLSPDDWIAADNEADQRRFQSFVARVPKPTMLQRFKAMRVEDVWIRVTVWALVMVFALVLAFLFSWVWPLVAGE
jgi:hypothetical protein